MSISCLDRFYDLLDELEEKIGGRRRLGDCRGRMDWPKRGIYFFFEPGEMRAVNPVSSRVVRVGASTALRKRIEKHKGVETRRGGDRRSSVFRRLVGDAIGQRNPELMPESWWQKEPVSPEMQELEYLHEIRVSEYLADMTLLFVYVPDASGADSMETVESDAIALLSGYRKSSPDEPSSDWLGRHSTREKVRHSGLWNNNHVDKNCAPDFLNRFEKLTKAM